MESIVALMVHTRMETEKEGSAGQTSVLSVAY